MKNVPEKSLQADDVPWLACRAYRLACKASRASGKRQTLLKALSSAYVAAGMAVFHRTMNSPTWTVLVSESHIRLARARAVLTDPK